MNIIYRNIQYKPRIWGLYFSSLFSVLGAFLIVLMILSVSLNIFLSLFISFLLFGGFYGYFYLKDNRDEVEYRAKKDILFKNKISSYSVSDQKIRFGK